MQYFKIHSQSPQQRLIRSSIDILNRGGVIVYPTDSSYAYGCLLGEKNAMDRIRQYRQVDKDHHFTLVCRDLSEISSYAHVSNSVYRLLKMATPGAYTFILEATRSVPKRLQHPKRKSIGLRIPAHPVVQALLDAIDQPLMSSTLILPEETMPMTEPDEIKVQLQNKVDLFIDSGHCGFEATSVIDLTHDTPVVLREGKGDTRIF